MLHRLILSFECCGVELWPLIPGRRCFAASLRMRGIFRLSTRYIRRRPSSWAKPARASS